MAKKILTIEMGPNQWRVAVVERRARETRLVETRILTDPTQDEMKALEQELSLGKLPLVLVPVGVSLGLQMIPLPPVKWKLGREMIRGKFEEAVSSVDKRLVYRLWPSRHGTAALVAIASETELNDIQKRLGSLAGNLVHVVPPPVALTSLHSSCASRQSGSEPELAVHFDYGCLLITVSAGEELMLVREVQWGEGIDSGETARRTARNAALEEVRRSLVHHDMNHADSIARVVLTGALSPRGEELQSWNDRLEREVILSDVGSDGETDVHLEYALCLGGGALLGNASHLDLLRPDAPVPTRDRMKFWVAGAAAVALALLGELGTMNASGDLERTRSNLAGIQSQVDSYDELKPEVEELRAVFQEKRNIEVALGKVETNALPLDLWLDEIRRRIAPGITLRNIDMNSLEAGGFSAQMMGSVEAANGREAARKLGEALKLLRSSPIIKDVKCRLDPTSTSDSTLAEEDQERIRFIIELELL